MCFLSGILYSLEVYGWEEDQENSAGGSRGRGSTGELSDISGGDLILKKDSLA